MRKTRRQKHAEPEENHERWLVSYADFITLLFAFFVVMYSVSSVNEGKYRVLSDTLDNAFSEPEKTLVPIQVGEIDRRRTPLAEPIVGQDKSSNAAEDWDRFVEREAERERLQRVTNQAMEVLSPYIERNLVDVANHDLWVEVDMKSSMLFASGSARLTPRALPLLRKIAEILRHVPNTIHIEGYTDNRPIATLEFPSNWQLSAGRAASVVGHLVKEGITPARMAAIGYGEYHPIEDNATPEGREKNRRVVLVLLSREMTRHKSEPTERERLLRSLSDLPFGGRRTMPTGPR